MKYSEERWNRDMKRIKNKLRSRKEKEDKYKNKDMEWFQGENKERRRKEEEKIERKDRKISVGRRCIGKILSRKNEEGGMKKKKQY